MGRRAHNPEAKEFRGVSYKATGRRVNDIREEVLKKWDDEDSPTMEAARFSYSTYPVSEEPFAPLLASVDRRKEPR